ncbi:MAG: winged helix-turn-helix transcriptional regulator [Gemmatimonadota bacterium]
MMESAPLQILPPAYRGPRGRILLDLKRNGSNTARGLAQSLGLSLNAVRHHLKELEADCLLQHSREQRGLGAPTFAFQLSAGGEDLFPQRGHEIVTQVLDRVGEQAGRKAVTGALEDRFDALAVRIELRALSAEPAGRLEIVRQALLEDGFMAEWTQDDAGYRLTEHHCAFRALALRFPEICEVEARFLRRVLSAEVERTAHTLSGCGACQYRVRFHDSLEPAGHPAAGRNKESV